MDKGLYVAMSGAKQTMLAQAKVANNLANVGTTGFKADLAQFRSMPAFGEGFPSRVFAMTERPGFDFNHGALITTGNDLDFAIQGEGWFAVQAPDGTEGYSRAGSLKINAAGVLEDSHGNLMLGEGGPVVVPPFETLEIGADGSISIIPLGAPANAVELIDRIRLVNPALDEVTKSADGLFRRKDGEAAIVDGQVRISSGMLEASNVNAVGELTDMIELSRQFELQVKLMENKQENGRTLEQLLQMSS